MAFVMVRDWAWFVGPGEGLPGEGGGREWAGSQVASMTEVWQGGHRVSNLCVDIWMEGGWEGVGKSNRLVLYSSRRCCFVACVTVLLCASPFARCVGESIFWLWYAVWQESKC